MSKQDKFEHIKITDENFEDVVKYNGKLFFYIGEEVYCEDYVLNIILHFDKKENKWVDVTLDLDVSNAKDYDFDKALEDFSSNPPWDVFDEVLEKRKKDNSYITEKNIKNNPRKVIGWISVMHTWYFSEDDSDEGFYAVVKNIRDNGYKLTGMQYDNLDLVPLLDNHKYVRLSSRSFGVAMALANKNYEQMGYASYAFGWVEEGLKVPCETIYDIKEIVVDKNKYADIESVIPIDYDFANHIIYLLSIPYHKDDLYQFAIHNINKIRLSNTEEAIYTNVLKIYQVSSLEEFDACLSHLKDETGEDTIVKYNGDLINEDIKHGTTSILILEIA